MTLRYILQLIPVQFASYALHLTIQCVNVVFVASVFLAIPMASFCHQDKEPSIENGYFLDCDPVVVLS